MSNNSYLHVAVGVIKNTQGEILISYRNPSVHQGGLWEFPGGKVNQGETVQQAMRRELLEELNISANKMLPLIKVRHSYSDLKVLLDVWEINAFSGLPMACEGQPLKWVLPDDLPAFTFPQANLPIITAVRLPEYYAILDGVNLEKIKLNLVRILNQGRKLIQLRVKSMPAAEIESLLSYARPLCHSAGALLLLNSGVERAFQFDIEGIHLTSRDLMSRDCRPPGYTWVAASCHSEAELLHGQKIGVDFVVLAPVMPTPTHPGVVHLGWIQFTAMLSRVNIPVYALGGMHINDMSNARAGGGQGVAGISMFIQPRNRS